MASSNTPLMSENPPPYAATAPAGAVPSYGAAPSGAVPGYGAAPAGAVPGYGAAHMEQPPTVPKSAPAGAYTGKYIFGQQSSFELLASRAHLLANVVVAQKHRVSRQEIDTKERNLARQPRL